MGSQPGQPGRAVPWARGCARGWGPRRAGRGTRRNHCLDSGATHVAGEVGASSLPALHLGGMNGGEAEPSALLRSLRRRGARPRSSFRQGANLREGQEARAADPGQGAPGVESSPHRPGPVPQEGAPRSGRPGAESGTPSPAALPAPPPRPGEWIGEILGREGEEAASAAQRSRGGSEGAGSARRGRVGGGGEATGRKRAGARGGSGRGGRRYDRVRHFLANLGEHAVASRPPDTPARRP